MKTREQLKAEYDSALERLGNEEQLRAALTERGIQSPSMVHQHKLYGSTGSIVFGDSYSGNDDKVTLEQLRDLLRALPPVSTVMGKGTFTRFMTETFADSDANKERDRGEKLTSIFPVTLKTNSVAGYSVKIEWFAEVDGRVWAIDAYMASPWSLAQVNARRVDFKGGHRYEDSRLTVSEALRPSEGYWQQIRWGRGSDEYPNDFTAYHTQYDEDPVAWIERVIQSQAKGVAA